MTVAAPCENVEDRLEIVIASARVTAIHFVNVNVADQIKITIHQLRVRFHFIEILGLVSARCCMILLARSLSRR